MDTAPPLSPPPSRLSSLLHEWFVEYNPTYLFSAALVLAGLTLVSCDLAEADALAGVGLTGVAEIYSLALIAASALLVRLGQRRVAVMVGLLAALYQCDLIMHTETCAFLGGVGLALALAWAALFHVKLRLLARALELRPSRSALAVPSLAALGMAVLPHALRALLPHDRAPVVALFVFAIGAAALWTGRRIESAVGYDYRGRRAIRGTWLMWAAGALAHVVYWGVSLGVDLLALAPVAVLLSTRWATRERSVWLACAAALGLVAMFDASLLPVTAAMVSVVLVLRALRTPTHAPAIEVSTAAAPAPYRGAPRDPTPETNREIPEPTFARASPVAVTRLLAGAMTSAHFSAWTAMTSGGLWRTHVLWLDLVLAVALVLALARARRAGPLVPLAALATHFAITLGWIRAPHHAAEYGVWSIGIGFALLGASLITSWWIAAPQRQAAPAG